MSLNYYLQLSKLIKDSNLQENIKNNLIISVQLEELYNDKINKNILNIIDKELLNNDKIFLNKKNIKR